jgi:phytoene/squalene synthetase
MPVEATVLPDGNYYLPKTDEVIPADMAAPSPDDRFHHCYYAMFSMAKEFDRSGPVWERKLKTRCFFAPMNSS